MVQKEQIKKLTAVSMVGVTLTLTVLAGLTFSSVFAQEEMVIDEEMEFDSSFVETNSTESVTEFDDEFSDDDDDDEDDDDEDDEDDEE